MCFVGFIQTHINSRAIPMYQNTQNRFTKESQTLSPTCPVHNTQRVRISEVSLFFPVFIHLTRAPCCAQVFSSPSDISAPHFCRSWVAVMCITEQGDCKHQEQCLQPSGTFLGKPTQTPSSPRKGAEAALVTSKSLLLLTLNKILMLFSPDYQNNSNS